MSCCAAWLARGGAAGRALQQTQLYIVVYNMLSVIIAATQPNVPPDNTAIAARAAEIEAQASNPATVNEAFPLQGQLHGGVGIGHHVISRPEEIEASLDSRRCIGFPRPAIRP